MTPTYDSFIFFGDPFGTNIRPSGESTHVRHLVAVDLIVDCFFVVSVSQVRSPGQRRGVAHPELRARSVPHPVQNCVGAVERLLRDGHAGHEEGEQQGSQFGPQTFIRSQFLNVLGVGCFLEGLREGKLFAHQKYFTNC